MTTEIRPPARAEAVDYLRVLPFANGLPSWEPAPAAWHGGPEAWPDPGKPATEQQLQQWSAGVFDDHVHPQAAFVDGRLVGATAMLALEITVPGSRAMPVGGVTSTAVIATHRRRGLLRAMMQAMFDEARDRGEPLAAVSASEGGIYGRYGFGPATLRTRWELARAEAAFHDPQPPPGSLELVDATTAGQVWADVHEQVRRTRVGEFSPQPGQWTRFSDDTRRFLVHRAPDGTPDGVANFHLPWSARPQDAGTLIVDGIQAVTPDAYRALWLLLTDFDLSRTVVSPSRPADEPLRWMLRNPRALRVTRQSDGMWIRLLDAPAALNARTYDSDDELTFAIDTDPMCPHNAGVWHVSARTGCERTAAAPDLTADIQALGSLYLGGMSAANLAAAGRIREHRPGAVAALSRMLRTDPEPFNTFGF